MDDLEAVESSADDLRSALAESIKAETPAATEAATETPPADKAERQAGERLRAPDGKFAPKETSDAPVEKAAAAPAGEPKAETTPEAQKTEPGEQTPSPGAAIEPPAHWSAADKEKFAALPEDGRRHFLDMYKRVEGWYTPKLQRLATLERDYAPVADIFAPHAEALRARGQAPADVIKIWSNVEQSFLTHKAAIDSGQRPGPQAAETVARMIAGYKIDPAEIAQILTGIASGQPPTTFADPRVDQLADQLRQLTAAETERQTNAQRESVTQHQRQIDTFANEKDGDGNLKHPFFAELEQDMMALAQLDRAQGRSSAVSELYDRAVWANPSTRDKLLAFQKESEAKRAAAERKAKSEAAAKAGVSVTGAPGPAQSLNTGQYNKAASATDDLRASMQELRG